ncbi:aldo/keto reductase [Branchiibius cervicis]|uniref:Aldo/keto reductase n=1 Tax=Branchiibius cervicis TaxID=908252 RepID=A0ABW2ATI9_9MICO
MTDSFIATTSLATADGSRDLPLIGLGTYPMKGQECADAVASAIGVGYRLIDTAAQYGNEDGVGQGIRDSGVDRETLVVTSKLRGSDHGADSVRRGLERSLTTLGLDYLDLYLIHWPNPSQGKYVESFATMLELQSEGLIRSVGTSNFVQEQLAALYDATGVWPAINQIQCSPMLTRTQLRGFMSDRGILTEAWGPLGLREKLPDSPVVQKVAEETGRSVGQVILRWHVQQGIIAIPKSGNPKRQKENADVFDFQLSDGQMERLSGLDRGEDAAWDSRTHEEF